MGVSEEHLESKDDKINYEEILTRWPWITEREQLCVVDPDSDGFLCALFMSHFLGWKIKGFYDGKVMILEDGVSPFECVFIDREIFRSNVRSVGHHIVQFNKGRIPGNWDNFCNCIQINNLRNRDFWKDFALKYPLATIHLLIGIMHNVTEVDITNTAICPLLFTDGTWMNLFEYTENSLSWLEFLRAEEIEPLRKVFCSDEYSVHTMMVAMDKFLRKRDAICASRERGNRERGDRLIISTVEGPFNLGEQSGRYFVEPDARNRAEEFIELLSNLTGWSYISDQWVWEGMTLRIFTKEIFKKDFRLSNKDFEAFIIKNPLSYAIPTNQRIEYTLEEPDRLGDG